MNQSYRLYANNTAVEIIHTDEWEILAAGYANMEAQEVYRLDTIAEWDGFWSNLHQRSYRSTVLLLTAHPQQGWQEVIGRFMVVAAAGGIVQNEEGHLLLIHRRGKWDFPKGKMEPGESKETSAVREVSEETGLSHLSILRPIRIYGSQDATWHTYQEGQQWICKPTYWFAMEATGQQDPVPQWEEDIEQAVWKSPMEVHSCMEESFPSLQDVWMAWQAGH